MPLPNFAFAHALIPKNKRLKSCTLRRTWWEYKQWEEKGKKNTHRKHADCEHDLCQERQHNNIYNKNNSTTNSNKW